MRTLALIATSILFTALSSNAAAYSGYIGGGFHMGKHKFNASYDSYDIPSGTDQELTDAFNATGSGITLKIGQYLAPSLAIEAHFVAGLAGDSFSHNKVDTGGTDFTNYQSDADFNSAWGLFAKPMGFVSESSKVYGLLGYGGVDFSIDNDDPTFKSKSPSSGIAYGLGFESEVEYGVFLGAEYVAYLDNADGSYDAFNIFLSVYVW